MHAAEMQDHRNQQLDTDIPGISMLIDAVMHVLATKYLLEQTISRAAALTVLERMTS
jgi:hypothetical protein